MSKKLRYSEVLKSFYRIQLSEDHADLCDTWFTGAACHLWRFRESQCEEYKLFHLHRHRLHVRLMMTIVIKFGDFSEAIDSTGRGLDQRESWNHFKRVIPDFRMFESITPDPNYPVGSPHPSDHYLYDPDTLAVFSAPSVQNKLS